MDELTIDLNADVGEADDAEGLAREAALIPLVSSINIACGFHAGSAVVIRNTLRLAREVSVAIGAHPSYPDREGFGRRSIALNADDLVAVVSYQVSAVAGMSRAEGLRMAHVKPHGALYHDAAHDRRIAEAVVAAVTAQRDTIAIVGPDASELLRAADRAGVPTIVEAFADRRYRASGDLVPRGMPGALIDDPADAAAQAVGIVRYGSVGTAEGQRLEIRAETLCLHGDAPGAPARARAVRDALADAGVRIAPVTRPAAKARDRS